MSLTILSVAGSEIFPHHCIHTTLPSQHLEGQWKISDLIEQRVRWTIGARFSWGNQIIFMPALQPLILTTVGYRPNLIRPLKAKPRFRGHGNQDQIHMQPTGSLLLVACLSSIWRTCITIVYAWGACLLDSSPPRSSVKCQQQQRSFA